MNVQEILEKWVMTERDTTPLWRLSVNDIEYEGAEDPTDGVEIAALAENIRQIGLIHPILVSRQKGSKKYRLISGRRRLEAISLLGRTHIAAIVVKCDSIMPLQIALSENIMRKSPHFLDRAQDMQTLLNAEGADKTARLFTVTESYMQAQLRLTSLSPYEKRLIRLLKLTENEALQLCEIENADLRKLLLEKIMESGEACDRRALIKQASESPDLRLTQSEKIYVRDIRVFLNSVERAAEMMTAAGFATNIERYDQTDSYEFKITVSKVKQTPSKAPVLRGKLRKNPAIDVSRETSKNVEPSEPSVPRDVSRETFKNAQLTIDEPIKS